MAVAQVNCEECSALLDYAYQRLAPITTWAI